MKKFGVFIILCLSMIALFGCGVSVEDALEKSDMAAEKQFSIINESNKTVDHISFYLDSTLTIEEESENNLLLMKGDQPIVLFYNPVIEKDSDQLFEQAKITDGEIVKTRTFESASRKDEFGYLLIIKHDSEKEEFEVVVGIGGVKATTLATTKELEKLTESMMELVSSVQLTE